jgi:hypothetical protein
MAFWPAALGDQSPHSLTGKFRDLLLHRIDVSAKRLGQTFLSSQSAFIQLDNRQAKAPFVSRAPTHVPMVIPVPASPPVYAVANC